MMRRIGVFLLAISLLLVPLSSMAAAEEEASGGGPALTPADTQDRGAGYLPYSDPSPFGSGGLLGAVARMVFSLVVVLGLLYAALWGLRKISSQSAAATVGGSVQVAGRLYLNPKVVIYFVRLVDELLVVGTSSGSISLLTTIKDARQLEQIESALKSGQPYVSGKLFSRFFDKSMLQFQKTLDKDEPAVKDQIQALEEQISRLKGLARRRRSGEN
jgi:flagellar biogenesis protein FliO